MHATWQRTYWAPDIPRSSTTLSAPLHASATFSPIRLSSVALVTTTCNPAPRPVPMRPRLPFDACGLVTAQGLDPA